MSIVPYNISFGQTFFLKEIILDNNEENAENINNNNVKEYFLNEIKSNQPYLNLETAEFFRCVDAEELHNQITRYKKFAIWEIKTNIKLDTKISKLNNKTWEAELCKWLHDEWKCEMRSNKVPIENVDFDNLYHLGMLRKVLFAIQKQGHLK